MTLCFSKEKNKILNDCIFFALLLIAELWFFRTIVFQGKLIGGDTPLNVLLLDHWYDVAAKGFAFNELRAFWPVNRWLGASDMMLGEGILHTVFRSCGADIFMAYNLTVILTHFMGVVFLWKALDELKVGRYYIFIAEFISFFSCSYSALIMHTQFIAYAYWAGFLYFAVKWWEHRNDGKRGKRIGFSAGCTFFLGLLFLTCVYSGYVLVLFMICFGVLLLVITRSGRAVLGWISKHLLEIFIIILLQAGWVIPFIMVHLPVRELINGGYPVVELRLFSAGFSDIFRTISSSPLERLYASSVSRFVPQEYANFAYTANIEASCGYPFISAVLFILSGVYSLKTIKSGESGKKKGVAAVWLTVLIILCVFLKAWDHSVWEYIRVLVPGGNSLRALARVMGLMTLPVGIAAAVGMEVILKKLSDTRDIKKIVKVIAGVILIALMVYVNKADLFTQGYISDYRAYLNNVPDPPEDCRVMMILTNEDPTYYYNTQTDSWLIAADKNLMTVNGYSGNVPPGWNIANLSGQDEYLNNVGAYLRTYGVQNFDGLYAYSVEDRQWIKIAFDPE